MYARPVGATSLRQSQIWPTRELEVILQEPDEKPKKKQSGFKKIWRIVTGTSKTDLNLNNRGVSQTYARQEENLPLAPPPPLSYLVDRAPIEMAATRHSSTPSLYSPSSKNILSSAGMSPPTAPSSVLPSPVSSGRPVFDREVAIAGRNALGVYGDRDRDRENADPKADDNWEPPSIHNVYPTILDPELRPRVLSSPSLPSNSQLTMSPRPISMSDREKSLPPLPGNVRDAGQMASPARPTTVFAYEPRHALPDRPAQDYLPPQAGFRGPDVRRQSFGGMISQPSNNSVRSQTALPRTIGYESARSLSSKYDEFAYSRRSLGRLEYVEEDPLPRSPTPNTKRKSKFGIASLFGKKTTTREPMQEINSQGFPSMRRSDSHHLDDGLGSGYVNGTNGLRQSGTGPRMSVTSRKAIQELVEQDPEFVAYRYPSNDHQLGLLR
jgi:hypothetical protein